MKTQARQIAGHVPRPRRDYYATFARDVIVLFVLGTLVALWLS